MDKSKSNTYRIRKGNIHDVEGAFQLIRELAIYEKAEQEVTTTVQRMKEDGFGNKPVYQFFVAEKDEEIIGLALFFPTYSTWKGRALHLEDLVVTQKHRRQGIGLRLFDQVVAYAKAQNIQRLTWQVLEWNAPAIAFYETLETNFDAEWINCKLTAKQIQNYPS